MEQHMCGSISWKSFVWNSTNPYIPECYRETFLVWIPFIFIFICSFFDIYSSLHKITLPLLPLTLLLKLKFILTIILCLISLCEVVFDASQYISGKYTQCYKLYSPTIKLFSFVIALCVQILHRRKRVHTSSILFFFWLLCSLNSIVNIHALLSEIFFEESVIFTIPYLETFDVTATVAYVPFVLLQLVLCCFPDVINHKINENRCPEEYSSFLSKIWFFWFGSMIRKGFKKSLSNEDMWDLSKANQSEYISHHLNLHWKPKRNTKNNIIWPIWRTFWPQFLLIAIIKFIPSCLTFTSPIILNWIIQFMKYGEYGHCLQPLWHGLFYVILMFISSCVESVLNSQYDYRIYTLAMRIRSCLIATIYRKILTLSPSGRKSFTTGEIVNVMSVDTQRVMEYTQIVNLLWICPLQIGISMYLLWQHLQYGSIAGLSIMLLLLPFNVFIGAKMRKQQIALLKQRDQRTKMMSEILNGIKVLKLYAWETSFVDQIKKYRIREISNLRIQAYFSAAITFAFNSAPFFVAIASFATFILISSNNVLDAQKAFVSLSIFNILRRPLAFFPQLITSTMMFLVSIRRINKYLNCDDLDEKPDNSVKLINKSSDYSTPGILLNDASFKWSKHDSTVQLNKINLNVRKNELIAIIGRVGSGKSSLLSAMLNEMYQIEGQISVCGSIAYVPQQAWILNTTVRNNILFGKEYIAEKYKKVIKSCELEPDLAILTGGDMTEIGEKGINLSGGQKQRISLARAVYNDADVYLLDDPLSAVDSHVGKHIFDNVIGPKGVLKKKTRVLVTHKIAVLPHVDEIVVFKHGNISECGTYSQLIKNKGSFAEFLAEFLCEGPEEIVEPEELEVIEEMTTQLERQLSRLSHGSSIRRKFSVRNSSINGDTESEIKIIKRKIKEENKKKKSKLINEEELKTGSVGVTVYSDYVKAIGVIGSVVTIISYFAANMFTVASSVWLSEWSDDAHCGGDCNDTKVINQTERLEVYSALGLGQTIFILIATITLNLACLRGSNILHELMLNNIIRAPMSFFDTTPIGRILNRFSKDIDTTDVVLLTSLRLLIIELFRAFATLVIIAMGTPIILAAFVPLGIVYYVIQKYYISTSRQLKRLESASRSPIYSHFSETVSGASSIRAYNSIERFVNESNRRVDINHSCYYASVVSGRWLSVRLEFLGNCAVFLTALFAVLSRGTLSPGNAGLSISYALTITATLNLLVRGSTDLESNVVSVERILEYTKVVTEAEWFGDTKQLSDNWPSRGEIGFCHYSTRYRDGLDLILNQISLNIRPETRVGIVGRTGAGKSSLTLALFRIIEAVTGSICIDGICISSLGLQDLRSRLTIIPQDPVLFTGSLRINLDPFNRYTDDQLWSALELAHLKEFATSLNSGLDYQITEGGDNLSVGQKQLLCLARALLKKSKILVLDEATAAVDLRTDDLIQRTIRKEFFDCTIVTIAHRLNTIMDYDMVIVMDRGQVVEYDSPTNLLSNKNSSFYSMVKDSAMN